MDQLARYGNSLLLAAVLGAGLGCAPVPPGELASLEEAVKSSNGMSSNGLSSNGLSTNGLSTNGLSSNGLSTNGLSTNGLSTNGFSTWFLGQAGGTAYTSMVMTYVVRCSLPSGQNLTATVGGVQYTWSGLFGLAPVWASGRAIPETEQQLVSACLGAHVNKFGLHVTVSMLGDDSGGSAIPIGATELKDYPTKEGCFFGNVFNGDGVFVGNDSTWGATKSSSRDCAITVKSGVPKDCSPMVFTDACKVFCTLDATKNIYTSCAYNGKTYLPMNSRISTADVFSCGDKICQISEHCGTGNTPDNCSDCGPC